MSEGLRIENVSAGYPGRPVIAEVSLPSIAPGAIVSLIGPNAAGKSTFLRALAGLLPSSGLVELGGRDLRAMSHAARAALVSYMPQSLPQGVALTVLESVLSALHVAEPDVTDDAAVGRAVEIMERIGIASLAMQRLDTLSGGQRQLTSLAQALVRSPHLLLLDEPTSALDLHYQLRVLDLVGRLARERGMIVMIVLHDLQAAARASDKIAILSEGKLVAFGAPEEAITPETLARVYHVEARVERCAKGALQVIVDGVIPA